MTSSSESTFRARIAEALHRARECGKEMLSVAFPLLPESAFYNLAYNPEAHPLYSFENTKKEIAVAGLELSAPTKLFHAFELARIDELLPKTRAAVSLAENSDSVPAPKLFISGTFEDIRGVVGALPCWQISRTGNATKISAHFFVNENSPTPETLVRDFSTLIELSKNPTPLPALPAIKTSIEVGGDWYFQAATRAVSEIRSGNLQKVVLARAKDFPLPIGAKFSAQSFLASARDRFLSAGCTLFSALADPVDCSQKLIGATPEILVRIRNGNLETEAIAGTISNSGAPAEVLAEKLFNDIKERHEHEFVVGFITEKLRALGLEPRNPQEPEIQKLPNVFHLRTPIHAECREIDLGKVASTLHPTPAMCGLPASDAKRHILNSEPFPREHFSAPIGFIDTDGNGFFAVAIRCAHVSSEKIRLYAGSGLVAESDPAKELDEINSKFAALAKFLTSSR